MVVDNCQVVPIGAGMRGQQVLVPQLLLTLPVSLVGVDDALLLLPVLEPDAHHRVIQAVGQEPLASPVPNSQAFLYGGGVGVVDFAGQLIALGRPPVELDVGLLFLDLEADGQGSGVLGKGKGVDSMGV